jgi:glucosamine--fructose-6-phosphate aminotransferase (isomerizing)
MVFAHTRWASVGAISPANCHPVDNRTSKISFDDVGVIQAALNGDIDNYQELKAAFEADGIQVPAGITTDTKIIPLQIHKFLQSGMGVEDAFRKAVNTFKGSHAIFMTTDLAHGKLFLAQKGSGQTIFVGLAEEHYMPVSEVYGFVEDTQRFVKMDGEKVAEGPEGRTQGQIFILDQDSGGSVSEIKAMYYNGAPIALGETDVKTTQITSRDIDRQNFPHYFLKEISEAPASVEKTLVKSMADSSGYRPAGSRVERKRHSAGNPGRLCTRVHPPDFFYRPGYCRYRSPGVRGYFKLLSG